METPRHMRLGEDEPDRYNALCEQGQAVLRYYATTIPLTSEPSEVECKRCKELMDR